MVKLLADVKVPEFTRSGVSRSLQTMAEGGWLWLRGTLQSICIDEEYY
jgi:hypothetical protein